MRRLILFALLALPLGAQTYTVGHSHGVSNASNTAAITLSSGWTAGDLLVVVLNGSTNVDGNDSVTDNKGNTYTKQLHWSSNRPVMYFLYTACAVSTQSSGIITGTITGSSETIISGVNFTPPAGTTCNATPYITNTQNTTTASQSVTTTLANSLIYAFADASASLTNGACCTLVQSIAGSSSRQGTEFENQTSTGSYTVTFSVGTARGIQVVAFAPTLAAVKRRRIIQ